MKKLILTTPSLAALLIFLTGCTGTSPSIIATGRDTYTATRISNAASLTDTAALRQEAIADANAFAAKQGKRAIPTGSEERPPQGGSYPSFEYHFRLVNP
ncbi:MAG: hypothetical protein EOP88_10315 [Verrucomicrobiaceae bacterium]|nr:MAG: hypothetical protein EOP88_10315 [Verrucomicrobiaceae bacterium]